MSRALAVLALVAALAGGGESVVEGLVVDEAGYPIVGAEVALVAHRSADGAHFVRDAEVTTVRTDDDGAFRLAVPNGAAEILVGARKEGRTPLVTDPVGVPVEEPLRLELAPGRRFTVRVVDDVTRRPLPGAVVKVFPRHNHNGPHVRPVFAWHFGTPGGVLTRTTDDEGKAVVEDFPAGVYQAEASLGSRESPELRARGREDHLVRFPEETEMVVELRPYPILDENGAELPPYAVARLGVGRWEGNRRHGGFAASADGSLLVGGRGPALVALDPATGLSAGLLGMGAGDVRGVAVCRDGKVAAAVSERGLLTIGDPDRPSWDARRKIRVCDGALLAVALPGDGGVAAAGGDDGVLRRYDVATGELVDSTDLGRGPITALVARSDGSLLAAAGRSVLVCDGDVAERATVRPLVLSLALSPDGRRLAAGAWGRVEVFHAADGSSLGRIPCEGGAVALAWGPGGSLVVGTTGGRLLFVREGRVLWDREANAGAVRAVAVSADGSRILAGGDGPGLRIYDAVGGEIEPAPGHFGPVRRLAYSPVAPIVASGGLDGRVLLWDLEARRLLHGIRAHDDPVERLAFSENGRFVVSATRGGEERWFDAATGRPAEPGEIAFATPTAVSAEMEERIGRMLSGGGNTRARVVSPDRRNLVTGTESGILLLWDLVRISD